MCVYLFGYGLGRFWIEGLRADQLIFFNTGIPVSQALSLVLILVSVLIWIIERQKMKKRRRRRGYVSCKGRFDERH